VLRERGGNSDMSEGGRKCVTALAEKLREGLGLS
jgi:hypothetical protein